MILCSASSRTALGVNHPVVLRTLAAGAKLSIGSGTGISGGSICAAVSIEIGKDVFIGANVTISDSDLHPLDPVERTVTKRLSNGASSPVIISDRVFLGTGAMVLKGVSIGEAAIVGAGAVVTKNVAAFTIVGGNPAREIGKVGTAKAYMRDSASEGI